MRLTEQRLHVALLLICGALCGAIASDLTGRAPVQVGPLSLMGWCGAIAFLAWFVALLLIVTED